jgi:uncharacterized membrane-anchored protein YitT (DUF2179 family)
MQELINRSGPEKRYFWMTEAKRKKIDFYYSPLWNLFLITSGSVIWALGVKAIVVHHQFITGGLFGVSLLFYYSTDLLSPGITYALLNIPLFAVGWIMVGRRFFFYSLYAMALTTIAYELISVIRARGAYTRRDRGIVMTITNNVQLKHLEQTVFKIDPHALFIVENTFNVIGSGFGRLYYPLAVNDP